MNHDSDVLRKLLELVGQHDGDLGWYQLDRELSRVGMQTHVPLAMQELEAQGFVRRIGEPNSASTRYYLTDEGRAALSAWKA